MARRSIRQKKTYRRRSTRRRRTFREIFLDQLTKLSGQDRRLVSNTELSSALEWNQAKYKRVKDQLREENAIIVGRGFGGSVGLADAPGAPGSKGFSIFVSYSHADEVLKAELLKHLQPLERLKLIASWDDRKIKAGGEWDRVISSKLEKADIILLLVSIDFINSAYCYDIELERALERHDAGEARVIPVILRSCLWQHTGFAKLQALPRDAKPITAWPDRDEAFMSVAEAVRQVADPR